MTQTSTAINAHNVTYESVFQADIVSQIKRKAGSWAILVAIKQRLRCMSKTFWTLYRLPSRRSGRSFAVCFRKTQSVNL